MKKEYITPSVFLVQTDEHSIMAYSDPEEEIVDEFGAKSVTTFWDDDESDSDDWGIDEYQSYKVKY